MISGIVLTVLLMYFAHPTYSKTYRANSIDALRSQWESKCLSTTTSFHTNQRSMQTTLKRGCVAYYLHNHKSGGTTMCHTALNSGYHITNLEDNCNLPAEIVNMDRRNHNRGIAQHYVLNHPKLTFVAQEQPPFYPNISNDRYIYITTLRDPIDRVISHLHHGICTIRTLENAQRFLHNGNCSIDKIEEMTLNDLILDECFDKGLSWLSSNYYVSMFTGCIVNRKKIPTEGSDNVCNRKHLLIAQEKLHYFSVIMITDTVEEFDRYSRLLELKLSMKFSEKFRVGTRENSKEKSSSLRKNASAYAKLMSVNSLDVEFFEYAKKLASSYWIKESQLLNNNRRRHLHSEELRTQSTLDRSPRRLADTATSTQPVSNELPFCVKFSG